MKPHLPAVLLAVFSLAAGTLPGGATFGGAAFALAAIWIVVALALPLCRDPLGLGERGRMLVPALLFLVLSSWLSSPVRRAGLLAVTLLPLWLLLPAAIAACWPDSRARRRGAGSIAAVVGVVAVWSLVDRVAFGSPRAAMPIGHHTALALWLVVTWPLVWAGAFSGRRQRWVGWAVVGLALAALTATGSLAGMVVALFQVVALWTLSDRREPRTTALRWAGLGVAGLAFLVVQGERLGSLLRGMDSSARARWIYLEAGLRGWSERPWLGWGPGSVPWTVADFLRPRPGLNPAGEVVGDLHSLPVQLAYELGALGLLAAVATAGLFWWRRWGERGRGPTVDRDGEGDRWRYGGLVALAGAVGMALTHAGLTITALPLAVAVAAGSALAVRRTVRMATAARSRWPGRALWTYRLAILLVLLPPLAAQFHYDRAVTGGGGEAVRAALDRAIALDPEFPLYRARRAWLPSPSIPASEVAAQSLIAARQGVGLSVLWLAAGAHGLEAGEAWAPRALARACRLDPLAAMAPYLLATAPITTAEASAAAVRAVLAEPLLAASRRWSRRPALRRAAVEELRRWPAVPERWKLEMAATWPEVAASPELRRLGLEVDRQAALAWSLHALRRRPWPVRLVQVEVDAVALESIDLAPAASLPETGREAFEQGCGEAGEAASVAGEWP